MLGSAFDAACKVRYPEAAIRALGKEQLDVSKSFEVVEEFRTFRPDLVIHCAALVNVERCESDLSDAESAILIGSKNVASACQQFSSKMIYPQSFLV